MVLAPYANTHPSNSFRLLLRLRHLLCRRINRVDDVRVAGATTKVAFNAVSDLLACRLGIALQKLHPGQNHSRRAITALQPVTFPKALLHRMQLSIDGQALDGRNLRTIRLDGQQRAGFHRLAIEEDRACASQGRFATEMRAGELAVIAQEIGEKCAGFDFMFPLDPIDLDFNQSVHGSIPIRFTVVR